MKKLNIQELLHYKTILCIPIHQQLSKDTKRMVGEHCGFEGLNVTNQNKQSSFFNRWMLRVYL
jgi:hypothetical protein